MMLLKFKIQNLSYLSVQTPRMNEYRSCLQQENERNTAGEK